MKVFTVMMMLGYITLMLASLLPVGHGFDPKHGTVDCVFSTQHESYCPHGVIDHITAWKSVFINMLPVGSVVLVLAAVLLIQTTAPFLLRRWLLHSIPITPFIRQLELRMYSFTYRAWQDLFARGILHPKLF